LISFLEKNSPAEAGREKGGEGMPDQVLFCIFATKNQRDILKKPKITGINIGGIGKGMIGREIIKRKMIFISLLACWFIKGLA
jgi:hypothetical protein